jgi:hypothetical protein
MVADVFERASELSDSGVGVHTRRAYNCESSGESRRDVVDELGRRGRPSPPRRAERSAACSASGEPGTGDVECDRLSALDVAAFVDGTRIRLGQVIAAAVKCHVHLRDRNTASPTAPAEPGDDSGRPTQTGDEATDPRPREEPAAPQPKAD